MVAATVRCLEVLDVGDCSGICNGKLKWIHYAQNESLLETRSRMKESRSGVT